MLSYLLGILAAMVLTVTLVAAFMRPPLNDLLFLVALFAATGAASGAIGFLSYRLGWWRRFRSLGHTLTFGYIVGAGLTLLNVWVTARLMFINDHDLSLAGVLLLFAGGVSVSFGYFLSGAISRLLTDLVQAAGKVSQGDFSARVNVIGRDELAQLGLAFNAMAGRLAEADREARALETARRDLVAWASHDLRTPLASLGAMLDALVDGVVSDPATVARYLQQSQSEIGRMNALIDDLFELAQMDAGKLMLRREASSLSDLISDTLSAFSARALAGQVRLGGRVDPGTDPVWMAPEMISRVLRNLVENALRHTPPGGAIELSARPDPGGVVISVRDSGAGIPAADLPRIFERFYRGDAARTRARGGSGAGLGLAIASSIIAAHDGQIWAESSVDRGTVLAFRLPREVPNSVA